MTNLGQTVTKSRILGLQIGVDAPDLFFSHALLLAKSNSTSHSAMLSIQWSVCLWQDPPVLS